MNRAGAWTIMEPKVTIITACYNSERHIEQTILSVLNQTYENIEYIIVDGASSDSTMEIVNRYRDQIDVVISERDSGIYDAFNKGIRVSTGDFIYFLNSDDYLFSDAVIEQVVKALVESGPDTMAVYGDILIMNEDTGVFRFFGKKADNELLKEGKMPPHPGMFVKRELFIQHQGFDVNLSIASDLDFVIKVFKEHAEQAVKIDQTIAVFRTGGASTQLLNQKKVRHETITVLKRHYGESRLSELKQEEYNHLFYKKWLELCLIKKCPASRSLLKLNIRKVAVFGSLETAAYVCEDLKMSQIETLSFLDNDRRMHGHVLRGVTVNAPEWLKHNYLKIDAIILAFGGDYEDAVRMQIAEILPGIEIRCISWRELIAWT